MLPNKKQSAWIIQWKKGRRNSTQLNLQPHILPWRWGTEKVFDYMRCIYWNSPLTTPYGTLLNINQMKPQGIFQTNQGPRLFYGDSTRLVAWHVKDLSFEIINKNKMAMKWTAPAGLNLDQTPFGESRHHRFEFDVVL
ncbi:MAG: hypothetical protein WCK57_08395 [Verrucomicrobiae bacterium]